MDSVSPSRRRIRQHELNEMHVLKETRISRLLSIVHPILQGGMLWLAGAELAAAVSNAGGLGVVSPLAGMEMRGDPMTNMDEQIRRTRELTGRSFGVNIPLDLVYSGLLINALVESPVPVVITAAGDPAMYTGLLKSAGITVLHVVSNVHQALAAQDCGADAIIAEGVDSGAHNGRDEIPLFALLPQVVDAVSIPVVAAGGIADARGFVAAMALGAEGIQLGTRFLTTEECPAHPAYKQAIIDAADADTTITCRPLAPARSLKTPFTRKLLELEAQGAKAEDIHRFLGFSRSRTGQLEGDLENGEAYSGAAAGLIREVLPAAEVIRQLVKGYESVLAYLVSGYTAK